MRLEDVTAAATRPRGTTGMKPERTDAARRDGVTKRYNDTTTRTPLKTDAPRAPAPRDGVTGSDGIAAVLKDLGSGFQSGDPILDNGVTDS